MTAAREDPTDTDKAAIFTRLRGVATAAVEHNAPGAPLAVKQEAVIRIATYAANVPDAAEGTGYAAIVRNSGALNLLGPWIPRRLGVRGDGTATPSAGSTGSTGGPGFDQTARDAAEAAQEAADRAQATADTARTAATSAGRAATAAQTTADGAATTAAAAGRAATAAQTTADGNAAKLMPPNNAEADAATSTTIRGWTAALIRRVVESIVPSWARAASPPRSAGSLPELPEDGREYTLRGPRQHRVRWNGRPDSLLGTGGGGTEHSRNAERHRPGLDGHGRG